MRLLANIRMIRRAFAPHSLGIDTNEVADPALRDIVACSLEPLAFAGFIPQRPDHRFPPLSLAMGTWTSGVPTA